jgi:hypothetical protein
VASYRHARDVIAQHGDPVMAPWLALTTDGMLLAALVVIWVRRHRSEHVKAGPWAAFWAGMAATIAANLAAAHPTPVGIVVALWPPVCLAITLELVALVASVPKHHPIITGTLPADWTAQVPDHAQPAPGRVPAETARDDRAPETGEAGHDTGTHNEQPVGEMPAEPEAETRSAPAAVPAGTNEHGHVPVRVPAPPAPDLRDVSGPAGQVPAPASGHGSGMEPAHEASRDGRRGPVRTGRVPDGDVLAWLREQAYTTGQVPGRRKMVDSGSSARPGPSGYAGSFSTRPRTTPPFPRVDLGAGGLLNEFQLLMAVDGAGVQPGLPGYVCAVRYGQGGGLSAAGRARPEQVRMAAAQRFAAGDKTADIAADLRVGVRQVEKWRSAFHHRGIEALRSKGPHTAERLGPEQFARLAAQLERGPAAHGFDDLDRSRSCRHPVVDCR